MWKAFLDENPNCTYEDLVSAFGSPEVFAGEMLATLDQKALKQAQTRRKLFQRCTAILVAAVLVLGTVFYAVKWYQAREVINGDFRIVHEDDITVTDEEYNNIFGLDSEETGENKP